MNKFSLMAGIDLQFIYWKVFLNKKKKFIFYTFSVIQPFIICAFTIVLPVLKAE